jgi:hypothetical protein
MGLFRQQGPPPRELVVRHSDRMIRPLGPCESGFVVEAIGNQR